MQFFNFGNEVTFALFMWFVQDSQGPLRTSLFEEALVAAEDNHTFDTEQDICYIIRDELAEAITQHLIEESDYEDFFEPACCVEELVPTSLIGVLLGSAIEQVHFFTVAEALLRHEKKWSPSLSESGEEFK